MELSEAWWAIEVGTFWVAAHQNQRSIFDVESGLLDRDYAGMMFKCIPGGAGGRL